MSLVLKKDILDEKQVSIIYANGCERSRSDLSKLIEYFRQNGWCVYFHPYDVKLILVFTCGFDRYANDKSISLLKSLKRKARDDAQFIVLGCLAEIENKLLENELHCYTLPPKRVFSIDEIIHATIPIKDVKQPLVVNQYVEQAQSSFTLIDNFRATIQLTSHFLDKMISSFSMKRLNMQNEKRLYEPRLYIARGCCGECSFCSVRPAMGDLVSKPLETILEEFREGLDQGYHTFHLMAGDVGQYGQDINLTIVDLLRELFNHNDDFQLVIHDLNPRWINKYKTDLIDLLTQNAHRIKRLWIPLQSGSEKILELMNRQYNAIETKTNLIELRNALPGVFIGTHIIVGFPGETEEHFQETIKFCNDIKFTAICCIKYADYSHVKSYHFPNKVSEIIKRIRIFRFRSRFFKEMGYIE